MAELLGVGPEAEDLILLSVATAKAEPWSELSDQLEQRYRIWGFQQLNLQVPDDMQVRNLWEVIHRFNRAHPEAEVRVAINDTTVIYISPRNPLERR